MPEHGASDFIQKPYPETGVIAARVHRTIELSEDRQIIQSTERDPKTGLYNPEFFVSYAEQCDQHHKETSTDAIVFDINHFSVLNERFGHAYADDVLKRMADKLRELTQDSGGIVTRSGADIFQVYCPHRDDYKSMLDKLSATLDDAWKAAELAGIADDIRTMPMGMQTLVSEGGGGVSGGQRQRIMIARAVCGNRRILMFDEATSALDNKAQKHVADSLASLRCTRIVIAHRLSTVRECDRILVVADGGIAEEGSYDELIERGGIFADLVKRQRIDETVRPDARR